MCKSSKFNRYSDLSPWLARINRHTIFGISSFRNSHISASNTEIYARTSFFWQVNVRDSFVTQWPYSQSQLQMKLSYRWCYFNRGKIMTLYMQIGGSKNMSGTRWELGREKTIRASRNLASPVWLIDWPYFYFSFTWIGT